MTSMQYRLNRLIQRRTDPRTRQIMLREGIAMSKLAKAMPDTPTAARSYVLGSMEPVAAESTERSFASARRVQEFLGPVLDAAGHPVTFEHQGSVTNNTHIEFHSDIDLLVLTDRFVTKQLPLRPSNPYRGDALSDLGDLRDQCQGSLTDGVPLQSLDFSGAKALSVNPPTVECKVDIVPANWIDTVDYERTGDQTYRGVYVFDHRENQRVKNFPFLHNAAIDRRDRATSGLLRQLIRLVKSVRCDAASRPAVSSYDIASLCYHLPDALYPDDGDAARLILQFNRYALDLARDQKQQTTLSVPNADRLLFHEKGLKIEPLILLVQELTDVLQLMLRRDRLAG